MVELYLHFPIHLHGMVLNYVIKHGDSVTFNSGVHQKLTDPFYRVLYPSNVRCGSVLSWLFNDAVSIVTI
jgi:hypothetical protein